MPPNFVVAPNFEKVGWAYYFWGVRASHFFCTYCNFKTLIARVLKFHIWIPQKKNSGPPGPVIFFFSELSPILELWSFENF